MIRIDTFKLEDSTSRRRMVVDLAGMGSLYFLTISEDMVV